MEKNILEEILEESVLEIEEVDEDSNFMCCIITGGGPKHEEK